MPTCPRCAALALVLLALAFTGCDSNNPGRDLSLIEGVYLLEELEFRPVSALPAADVDARINVTESRFEIFGDDEESQFVVRFNDGTTSRIDLRTTASRGRATFEAADVEDTDKLKLLLLPRSFTLTYQGDSPRVLEGTMDRTGVDLEAFDPSLYQGEVDKSGTTVIRFRRR